MTSRPPSFDSFNVEFQPQTTPPYASFILVVLGLVALHRLLAHYDITPRAIAENLWNIFVHVMPAPLVFALGQPSFSLGGEDGSASTFAAKNEVLRKLFGLDGFGMLKAISGDRALRTYGTMINSKDAVPPGLGNWDNSCYQNSVIQGLASIPSLQRFLLQGMTSFDGLASDSTNGALLDTVQKLNNPEYHGRHLWTPAKLKNMSSWQQQDAQEYFSKVLDEIDREILRASRQSCNVAGLEDAPLTEEKAVADPVRRPNYSTFPENLRNPLEGLLAQRVGCMNCGHTEGLSMIPFNCLTVPLQKDWGYGCDIRDCLNEYTKLEPIEGVECSSCTLLKAEENLKNLLENAGEPGSPGMEKVKETSIQRLQAVQCALGDEDFSDNTVLKKCHIPRKSWVQSTKSRQAVIGRPPKALVIHVNRSVFDEMTGDQRKNYAHVSFPEILDLGPWSLGSGEQPAYLKELYGHSEIWSTNPSESMISSNYLFEEPKLPYQLRAVVSHYGRHENGHYVCYRKHPFNSLDLELKSGDETEEQEEYWWRQSDEDVSRVSKDDVLAQGGVFMLFYEALPPPPPKPAPAGELTRRSSNSTIRAVASAQSPVGLYSTVEEGEDESEDEELRGRWTEPQRANTHLSPGVAAVGINSDTSTPELSELDYGAGLSSSAELPSSHTSFSSRSASPNSQPSEHNPSLEDTIVLKQIVPFKKSLETNDFTEEDHDDAPKKHRRDRNSTISVGSSNRAPTPLSPISNPPMSPQRTPIAPYAFQVPFSFNEHPASPQANPLFDGLNPNSPIAQHGVNLDPAMRRVIEETIQREEGGARWSTSRSEYAPSTVGGTESEYAPSSASVADSDVSDAGPDNRGSSNSVDSGSPLKERDREEQRPQSRTSNQSQGLAMRTAGAAKGEHQGGEGSGKMGLEGLRMVTAT